MIWQFSPRSTPFSRDKYPWEPRLVNVCVFIRQRLPYALKQRRLLQISWVLIHHWKTPTTKVWPWHTVITVYISVNIFCCARCFQLVINAKTASYLFYVVKYVCYRITDKSDPAKITNVERGRQKIVQNLAVSSGASQQYSTTALFYTTRLQLHWCCASVQWNIKTKWLHTTDSPLLVSTGRSNNLRSALEKQLSAPI